MGEDESKTSGVSQGKDGPKTKPGVSWMPLIEGSSTVLASSVMLALIFGGCCSNVYALEAIINFEPANGILITFVQFVFVATTGYVAQFDKSRPPFFVAPNKVPLGRWLVNIVLFFAINLLNNHAFSYDISVPVHIILRSGGSITTMAAGYLVGKRYSRMQCIAVILLTLGVILAAWSDAKEKVCKIADCNTGRFCPNFVMSDAVVRSDLFEPQRSSDSSSSSVGLLVLFVAQVLSSAMGLYTESTYKLYGPQWKENLFYSHALSLPLFLPFARSMARNLRAMAQTEPLSLDPLLAGWRMQMPSQLAFLTANMLTQFACIRGVNLLAANASALTVTIVLNIRKLVSLLLSIWLFGNPLSIGTLASAVLVFGAAGLYTVGSRPRGGKSKKDQ